MPKVLVRELIAWDLDSSSERHDSDDVKFKIRCGQLEVCERSPYQNCSPVLVRETESLRAILEEREAPIQESREFDGLKWSVAIVDLRKLIAFQRRLCFDFDSARASTGVSADWMDLLDFTLPMRANNKPPAIKSVSKTEIEFRSGNPNFGLKLSSSERQNYRNLFEISYGSPFMEVAQYQGRWFLRDGYHRAYNLLKKEIVAVPAVVVEVQTLEALGAAQPWFFSEKILFSSHPPQLTDFQNQNLVLEYERPAREKVIRVSLQESYELRQEDVLQTR